LALVMPHTQNYGQARPADGDPSTHQRDPTRQRCGRAIGSFDLLAGAFLSVSESVEPVTSTVEPSQLYSLFNQEPADAAPSTHQRDPTRQGCALLLDHSISWPALFLSVSESVEPVTNAVEPSQLSSLSNQESADADPSTVTPAYDHCGAGPASGHSIFSAVRFFVGSRSS
jgi:hypothetical protein